MTLASAAVHMHGLEHAPNADTAYVLNLLILIGAS